jgi:hypothetical protein
MVAAQCRSTEQESSISYELGCTTIEPVGGDVLDLVSASTFRISITRAGLDKAHKKTWAGNDEFRVWMEFDICGEADVAAAGLCWDSPPGMQQDAPKARREVMPKARGGLACCAARPEGMERVRARPGMDATTGYRYTADWVEPEPEPTSEPAFVLEPAPAVEPKPAAESEPEPTFEPAAEPKPELMD